LGQYAPCEPLVAVLYFFTTRDIVTDSFPPNLDPSILLQLQEEERQRLAHSLMQGPGQVLANTLMEIEYSLPLLEKNPQAALNGLNALRDELRDGLTQLKNYVAELQPPLLEEMGLGPSINLYLTKFTERTGIESECLGCEHFQERYPKTIELNLFRILQEALTNVETHAKATGVRVELTKGANQVQMTIQDDGRGFAPLASGLPKKRQLGLIVMRDRAEFLGGQMQLFSEQGRGVRLIVTIPYHGHADDAAKRGGQNHERNNHTQPRSQRTGSRTKGRQGERKQNSSNRKSTRA
jgi:two-component system, NarL family, sensor histidine kinase DegS